MNISKINFLLSLDEIIQASVRSSADLPGLICEFLSKELEFEAVAFFKINPNNSLELLGKSANVKKSLELGNSYNCDTCTSLRNNQKLVFSISNNCKIPITEHVLNSGCVVIPLSNGTDILIKISNNENFSLNDIENLNKVSKLLKNILEIWLFGRGGVEISASMIISNIAQELRTPANSIVGFTSLLSEESLSPSQNEYVSNLKENAFALLTLLNDLIDISKVENGTIKPVYNSVNLLEFISDIITAVKNKSDNKAIELIFDVDRSIDNNIKIDSQKVKYILQSLLHNSIKLTDRGRISLTVSSQDNKHLNFKVIDTSGGLSSKKLSDFFKPFGLWESFNSKISNISGLSLYLAKKYVEMLGGYITVTSNIGKGNFIEFSILADVSSRIEKQLEQIPKPTASKNKILVIEDDYASSKLLSNYLTKWGYDPLIVNSSKQAFEMIESEVFLAIMIDVNLPDISGFELMKQLRAHPKVKHTPIIVLTVEAEEQKAFLMGGVEYFQKPINYRYLVETLMSYKLRKDSTILIVDDDVPTLNLIKSTVEQIGFNTIALSDSSKVMSYIENTHLDLAIIDLDMPIINGFELIKLIKTKKQFFNLPIIIYTGKESFQEELKKIEGMFTELLHKSSTKMENLADAVASLINRADEPTKIEELKDKKEGYKILLVEDYKHSQIIVTRLLKKNNFESVVVVENGLQALEAAKQQKFDLILMDMQMPVMNGFEATQKIRELPEYKDTPIIALTAFAMKGDRERCLEAGATDYIPKPIDSQEFIEKVKFYTEKRHQLT
ncbi:MAG: response regulator [Ignavibacterium sp.]|nr:response regulator [Ignavibacterium sp.]MDW8376344.1 response regulator [Ignavibacteriales bacterium]